MYYFEAITFAWKNPILLKQIKINNDPSKPILLYVPIFWFIKIPNKISRKFPHTFNIYLSLQQSAEKFVKIAFSCSPKVIHV